MHYYKKITKFVLIISSSFFNYAYAFDWDFYNSSYPDLAKGGIVNDISGFFHFLNLGFSEARQSAPTLVNTNFDWEYYRVTNSLFAINSEQEALQHYNSYGSQLNLRYCKPLKIAILLHLYNLELIDEFIDKINYFMQINSLNDFYIKINIALAKNIQIPLDIYTKPQYTASPKIRMTAILQSIPYQKKLVTEHNAPKLYALIKYLKEKLALPEHKIQIVFSENRGLDVGGFLLLLDQLFKQNLSVDYIVKIHSKSNLLWRTILTSLLNLRVNKLLRTHEFVHSCKLSFDWANPAIPAIVKPLTHLFNYFKLPKENFTFAAGTMFISSSKMVDFFKKYDLVLLYNGLTYYTNYASNNVGLEHGYEWFFGYLAKKYNLNTKVIDYIPRDSDPLLKK